MRHWYDVDRWWLDVGVDVIAWLRGKGWEVIGWEDDPASPTLRLLLRPAS
jgi:hypothetical protein